MSTTPSESQTKSGIRTLKPSEVLFNDGDIADSLYIIQKGQIRLYKPKGKGFVEIGVLRSGEVIGEMAYFDEDGSGRKRSCSASAITPVEVIEISFVAFGKTMHSLNPWFKTIINTLVTRMRKANVRIKELEDNQVSLAYGPKPGTYEFLKPIEVMRILGTIFLVFKSHGDIKQQAFVLPRKTLNLYTQDMYQIMDVKLESVLNILVHLGWMEIQEDQDKAPNILLLKNIEILRQLFIYYNGERHLPEEKKLKIGDKCEQLIAKMIELAPSNPLMDIPNLKIIDDVPPKFTKYYKMTPVLMDLKATNPGISLNSLEDGKNVGLFGEVVKIESDFMVEVDLPKVTKLYPVIRFMNAIRKNNADKTTASYP